MKVKDRFFAQRGALIFFLPLKPIEWDSCMATLVALKYQTHARGIGACLIHWIWMLPGHNSPANSPPAMDGTSHVTQSSPKRCL